MASPESTSKKNGNGTAVVNGQEKQTYLGRLTYNKRLDNTLFAGYLRNIRLTILLLISVIGVGLFAFFTLPRELNPSINIPIIFVQTALPGAGPDDVEQLVTIPIEDEINSIDGINQYTSTSLEGVSSVSIEFESGIDPDEALSDVQQAVDQVTDLPGDATTPNVSKLDFTDAPVWVFSLEANGDEAGLLRFARILQDRVEEISLVDRVGVFGKGTREIQVTVRPEIVRELGITPGRLSQQISNAINSYPAGNLNTETSQLSFTIDPSVTDISDLRSVQIVLSGEVFELGEIASVTESTKPGEPYTYQASPEAEANRIVTFYVYKTTGAKIDETVNQAIEVVEAELVQYQQFTTRTIINNAQEITDQFNELGINFATTIFLVFIVMLIFLGAREAIVASLTIPLSIMITFFIMQMTGITISFISLFSLLLALGLLVDNAIVIISAISSYARAEKFTPYQTGVLVFKDFFVALLATNITTVWAFLPLLLASGVIGEFIKPIPIVVSTAILSSALVGFLLTLPIGVFLLKPNLPGRVKVLFWLLGLVGFIALVASILSGSQIQFIGLLVAFIGYVILTRVFVPVAQRIGSTLKNTPPGRFARAHAHEFLDDGLINSDRLSNAYRSRLERILSKKGARWLTVAMVVIFSLVSYALPATGLVQNEFFPAGDSDYVYVSVEYPSGTNLEVTQQKGLELLQQLRETPELQYVTMEVGRNAPDSESAVAGNNTVLFTVNLTKGDERDISALTIAEDLRNRFEDYQGGNLSVITQSGGPPAGSDIQITYLGDDLAQLDQYANSTMEYLSNLEGTANVDKSIKSGTSKIVFTPDSDRLLANNISERDLGTWLRSYASGYTLGDLTVDGEEYDIIFRLSEDVESPETIGQIFVPTQTGDSVPLLALGTLELKTSPTVITRQDGDRSISVSASVREGYNIPQIGSQLEEFADTDLGLAPGYEWQTGGVNEENQRSVQSIIQAMGLSAMLILITLVLQLGSFRKAVIVMLVIPLAISGVFIQFGIFGIPLSFPALIGVLALFGIVVNNSIIIVEKINQNLEAGFGLMDAVSDASASRLQPILLTTITTIIGLLPITLSDPIWMGLGGAIIAGLTLSGALMLFFIPVVYYIMFTGQISDEESEVGTSTA